MGFRPVDQGEYRQDFRPVDQRGFRTECTKGTWAQVATHGGPRLTYIACGKCDHCRWVLGQSRAGQVEMALATADWCKFVTLTIADGPKRPVPAPFDDMAKVMDKRAFPLFIKRLRNNATRRKGSFAGADGETRMSYMQCGEFGGKRGRVHYHGLIFGNGPVPDWSSNAAYRLRAIRGQKQRLHIPEWPFGHVVVEDDPDGGVAFYLSKYMRKDKGAHFSQSSGQAIGADWIRWKARRLADNGAPVPTLNLITEVAYPGKDFWRRSRYTHVSRKALIRNANARNFVLAFAEARGVNVMSFYRLATPLVRTVIVAAERWRRERQEREANGGRLPLFASDRIKLAVVNEARAMLGLPLWLDASGKLPPPEVAAVSSDGRASRVKVHGQRFVAPDRAAAEAKEARRRMSDAMDEHAGDPERGRKRRYEAAIKVARQKRGPYARAADVEHDTGCGCSDCIAGRERRAASRAAYLASQQKRSG